MAQKIRITQIGNSMGVVLPRETLKRLNLSKGDELFVLETEEGLTLTPYAQDFDEQMAAADKVLKQYRNALRRLAK